MQNEAEISWTAPPDFWSRQKPDNGWWALGRGKKGYVVLRSSRNRDDRGGGLFVAVLRFRVLPAGGYAIRKSKNCEILGEVTLCRGREWSARWREAMTDATARGLAALAD